MGLVLAALVVLFLGVYGWAWALLDSSAVARALIWMDADVGDQQRFPARASRQARESVPSRSVKRSIWVPRRFEGRSGFKDFLRQTDTLAFLVAHAERLVYERYFRGSNPPPLDTTWSVAKSVTSTLVGIALTRG